MGVMEGCNKEDFTRRKNILVRWRAFRRSALTVLSHEHVEGGKWGMGDKEFIRSMDSRHALERAWYSSPTSGGPMVEGPWG